MTRQNAIAGVVIVAAVAVGGYLRPVPTLLQASGKSGPASADTALLEHEPMIQSSDSITAQAAAPAHNTALASEAGPRHTTLTGGAGSRPTFSPEDEAAMAKTGRSDRDSSDDDQDSP